MALSIVRGGYKGMYFRSATDANGRLRRWLPRQTNPDDVSDEDIQEILMTFNLAPRKCLGYRTPVQALFSERGKDVRLRFA